MFLGIKNEYVDTDIGYDTDINRMQSDMCIPYREILLNKCLKNNFL